MYINICKYINLYKIILVPLDKSMDTVASNYLRHLVAMSWRVW